MIPFIEPRTHAARQVCSAAQIPVRGVYYTSAFTGVQVSDIFYGADSDRVLYRWVDETGKNSWRIAAIRYGRDPYFKTPWGRVHFSDVVRVPELPGLRRRV